MHIKIKRVVVKVGSSTLSQGGDKLSHPYMVSLVEQISQLVAKGIEVILVSSGAIMAGREVLRGTSFDHTLATKQMLSSIGQVKLMEAWVQLFKLYAINVGQILLTRDDLADRKRYINARDTFESLLKHQIIPIVNENDTVATTEIRVGDNDNLAALVANLTASDCLILLTDQEGLYTEDPRLNPKAELISLVENIDELKVLSSNTRSTHGTGGMATKIEAAKMASQCGIRTIVAPASRPHVLKDLIEGHKIGTLFMEKLSVKESRKRWLLSERREGFIYVDEGAVEKILHGGASLLPCGITKSEKKFGRGAVVEILSPRGETIAVGISNYNHNELEKIMGKKTNMIEELLGYSYGPHAIHRNDMVSL